MGVTSLVLGIVSVVIAVFFPYIGWIGLLCGIVGIILAAMGKKKGEKGVATAGLVLSIIGAALALIFWLACAACISATGSALSGLI